jgi:hypothetical protein
MHFLYTFNVSSITSGAYSTIVYSSPWQIPTSPLRKNILARLYQQTDTSVFSRFCLERRMRLFNRLTPFIRSSVCVWGDQSNRQIIKICHPDSDHEQELSITSNCFAALRRLRYEDKTRVMWIDAICIEQSSKSERSHQITLMTQIYSRAAEVVVYLGEKTGDSGLAMRFISQSRSMMQWRTSSPALVEALSSFLQRPWFKRIWVIQEVLFSRSAVVVCGSRSFDWGCIKTFYSWHMANHWIPPHCATPFHGHKHRRLLRCME